MGVSMRLQTVLRVSLLALGLLLCTVPVDAYGEYEADEPALTAVVQVAKARSPARCDLREPARSRAALAGRRAPPPDGRARPLLR